MKFVFALMTLAFACSEPSKHATLREESGGQKSVVQQSTDAPSGSDAVAQPDTKSVDPSATPIGEGNAKTINCTSSAPIGKNKKICETTVQGIKVKFVPLADGVPVSRLAFYLHGDTAADWKDPFVVSSFVDWAASKNILLVMPLSTAKYDDDKAGDQSYGAAQPEDAEKLAKLVGEFVATYKTPSDNLLYFGESGGPWFMSSSYIPIVGGRFPGLFALSCGASTFWQNPLWDYKNLAIRNKIKIFFNYGDKDFLLSGEEQSFAYYEKKGFVVSKKYIPELLTVVTTSRTQPLLFGKQTCDLHLLNATHKKIGLTQGRPIP